MKITIFEDLLVNFSFYFKRDGENGKFLYFVKFFFKFQNGQK